MRLALLFLALLVLPASASAGTLAVDDRTATFTAAPGEANAVTYATTGSDKAIALVIADTGAPVTPGDGCTAVDANTVSCPARQIESLKVALGDGSDTFAPGEKDSPFLDLDVNAGAGDDNVLAGGYHQNDNTLDGGAGADTITSGEAVDTFIDGDSDPDTLTAGDELFDELSFAPRQTGVTADAVTEAGPDGGTIKGFKNLIGSKGDDTLTGEGTLLGGPGDDKLRHGPDASFESLLGGPGDDDLTTNGTASGQAGNDALHGLGKRPSLASGAGDDTFDAERGGKFRGLEGQDTFTCGRGTEVIVYPDPG
ncbi:MAG: hypothetical protein QOI61_1959, partial [Actinomycetota bacterium]